jgi:hypothetical protein
MIKDDLDGEDLTALISSEKFALFDGKFSIQEGIFIQEILSDLLKLKKEVAKLQKDVSKNKLMIEQLERKKDSYGKVVAKRASSMLSLINDFGGAMVSTETKKFMGLSKDEFYRTVQYAKKQDLIELWPNLKDGRNYIIKLKL